MLRVQEVPAGFSSSNQASPRRIPCSSLVGRTSYRVRCTTRTTPVKRRSSTVVCFTPTLQRSCGEAGRHFFLTEPNRSFTYYADDTSAADGTLSKSEDNNTSGDGVAGRTTASRHPLRRPCRFMCIPLAVHTGLQYM